MDPPSSPRLALSKEIMELRLRYDAVNTECKQVLAKMAALRDRSTSFVNSEELSANADDDAAEIAELEAELNRTAVRAYEAWETRKTYEQVIKRLKDEGTTYPRELGLIDHTARAKEHDYQTLQLMLKDASHVRDVARHELSKVDESVQRERKERSRALREKRRKLQQKQEAAQAHERRVAARREALEREKQAAMARREVTVTASELASEREQIAHYEAQFAQIKEVAGADGVQEVIDKFTAQEETHATLVALSRESQSRIDKLIAQRAEAKRALEHARYVGGPLPEPSDLASAVAAVNGVDERERQHDEAQLQGQRERQRAQRLHRVGAMIVEVRANPWDGACPCDLLLLPLPPLPTGPAPPRAASPAPASSLAPTRTALPRQARVAIEHLSNIVNTTAQLPGTPTRMASPAATAGESEVSDAALAEQLKDATAQLDALFAEVTRHEGRSPLALARQLPRPASSEALLADEGPPQGPQDEAAAEAEARVLNRDAALLALAMEAPLPLPPSAPPPPRLPLPLSLRHPVRTHPTVCCGAQEGEEAGPIFKPSMENVRIDAADDDDDEEEEEDEDPDNPTDPVVDRETLKKNARMLLKKQTKTGKRGHRRKGGGAGDDDGPRPSSGGPDGATRKAGDD